MRIFQVFIFFLSIQAALAQTTLQGVLKDQKKAAVSHASVTVRNVQNRIVAFGTSDSKGSFQVKIPSKYILDSLHLHINHLGYAVYRQDIMPLKSIYEIVLVEQEWKLEEVLVRNRPVLSRNGDTLSYEVGQFAQVEDRSIEDVLKKLPGITVADNGEISFNGQSISNFFIDGDDLLGGRYALGSKTIPHAMVQKLEVIQNHQPIKVLKNLVASNQIAINLVIKDEARAKLTGQMTLGAGVSDAYQGEANTILFNKKWKFLNVIKGNSIGQDLSSDLYDFFSASSNSGGNTFLKTGTTNAPLLQKKYYFDNLSGSYNFNNLFNTQNDWQIKTNFLGYKDKNHMQFGSESQYYLSEDTVSFYEQQSFNAKPNQLNFEVSLNKNVESFYFLNTSKFIYNSSENRVHLVNQELNFNQNLQNFSRNFTNNLQFTPKLGQRQYMSFAWNLNYKEAPEQFIIEPGLNAHIFNKGEPFKALNQYVSIPKLTSLMSVQYRYPIGKIGQTLRAEWMTQKEEMQSQLRILQNSNDYTPYEDSFDNRLHFRQNQWRLSSALDFKNRKWELSATLPIIFRDIHYYDHQQGYDRKQNRIWVNPSANIKYIRSPESFVTASYNFGLQEGGVLNAYRGAVLINYRSLQANGDELSLRNTHQAHLQFNFQKAVKLLFINMGIDYSKGKSNSILSTILDNHIAKTVLIPIENTITSYGANVGMSKYVFALGATTALKLNYSETYSQQYLNEEFYPNVIRNFQIHPSFEARFFTRLMFNYNAQINLSKSSTDNQFNGQVFEDQRYTSLQQNISLNYNFNSFLTARMTGRHQFLRNSAQPGIHYYFIDAFARYRNASWKMDFELDMTNLADVRTFKMYSITPNQSLYSYYNLRGRMIVLRTVFNL